MAKNRKLEDKDPIRQADGATIGMDDGAGQSTVPLMNDDKAKEVADKIEDNAGDAGDESTDDGFGKPERMGIAVKIEGHPETVQDAKTEEEALKLYFTEQQIIGTTHRPTYKVAPLPEPAE